MLQKSLSLSKYTCIQFDLLILGDKSDVNMFQDIQIWLGKPIAYRLYVLNLANEKKKALNNAIAIIWYLIMHVTGNSVWQSLVS